MIHTLHAPGSVYGPCDEGCIHPRCEVEKMAAKQSCTSCNKPIGFGNRYTFVADLPVHVDCLQPKDYDSLPEQDPPGPTTSTAS